MIAHHIKQCLRIRRLNLLHGPVVQKVDNAIHWINLYPMDNAIGFPHTYLLDSTIQCLNNQRQENRFMLPA